MKIYIAYKFSDNDKTKLRESLETIANTLEGNGHNPFIFFRDIQSWGEKQLPSGDIIKQAFQEIRNNDVVLAFISSPEKSEGLLLEVGYAKALGKEIILVIKQDTRAVFLRDIADRVIEYTDESQVQQALATL